ncbi:hypothetical protein [Verrucomicrobium sp. BvORR034]|uniref:hypothetical protein n=1 Tax=Verrucomicrobium sp. BvORR034 TaxID=1396418 RepID=UPI000679B772|nr:hypothetical protein [Verrucomicrobium sp. BvORR034]
MSDSQETTPPLDLSSLRLAPSWVADFGKSKPSTGADFPEEDTRQRRDFKDRGRDGGRGGMNRGGFGDRRGPGGPGGGGGDRRSFDKPRSGPGGDRRDDRRGGGFRGDRDRGGRQYGQDDRGGRPSFDQAPRPVPGLTVGVEPEARATEAMAAMIRTAGKAYSVFDAARLVLANGERFHVKFSLAADAPGKLYTVPQDGSLWLGREDALAHFLHSEALKEFYVSEQIELEEPKGNFTSVAVCGMSGEPLGPPSHHSYQTNLHRLHRERFNHLPFEEYKRRVRTDNTPEAVEKWKESQKHGTQWVWQKGEVAEGAEPLRFKSRSDMETHFRKEHADNLVGEVSEATVSGNIPKRLLAPALYNHLRRAVDEARKHLLATAQQLCSGFEHHGLKLFKRRGGKLWVSRVRPRSLDSSVVLSDRIAKLVELIKTKPGVSTKELLDLVAPAAAAVPAAPEAVATPAPVAEAPAEAPAGEETPALEAVESVSESAPAEEGTVEAVADTTEAPTEAPAAVAAAAPAEEPAHQPSPEHVQLLKDLHWLNSEGYVIEYADGVVFPGVTEPPPAKPKPVKAQPAQAAASSEAPAEEAAPSEEEPTTEVAAETEAPVEVPAEVTDVVETEPAPYVEVDALEGTSDPVVEAAAEVASLETAEETPAEGSASQEETQEITPAASEEETDKASA